MLHEFISDIDVGDLAERLHLQAIVEALPSHVCGRGSSWYSSADAIPLEPDRLRFRDTGIHTDEGWYSDDAGPWSAYARRDNDGEVHLHVAGASEEVVAKAEQWFRDAMPKAERDPNAPNVPVAFWSLSGEGPASRRRRLDVPTWEGISSNYPAGVREQMSDLVTRGPELAGGGKLVLWHGSPGTGKTWGLRALASEWREWCDLHYVTDPETFFGASASYMLGVLLADEDEGFDFDDDDDVSFNEFEETDSKGNRWRLLVMEDTGELLSADAKERAGQGLSRLLNTVDGLIGQGLKIMVLITTNEELRNLHPAVKRPGRCASLIRFESFGTKEAQDWLERHDYDEPDLTTVSASTIADLYAKLNGIEAVVAEPPALGFAR